MELTSWHYCFTYLCITIVSISQGIALHGENVRNAKPDEFAFIVSIGKLRAADIEERQFCTGTLIAPDKVLTAAHCLIGEKVLTTEIIVGSASLPQGKRYRPRTWTSYDMWKNNARILEPSLNDIAIITLSQSVDLPNVKPAKIQVSANQCHSTVRIAGWGRLENGTTPTVMRTAEVKTITKEECEESVGSLANEVIYLDDNFFCSLSDPWILTSCGDSGAPILNENKKVIGISIGSCPDGKKLNLLEDIPNDKKRNLHLNLYNFADFIDGQGIKLAHKACYTC